MPDTPLADFNSQPTLEQRISCRKGDGKTADYLKATRTEIPLGRNILLQLLRVKGAQGRHDVDRKLVIEALVQCSETVKI